MTEWKVVPLEATEEMLRAGAALLCDPDDPDDIKWQREEWAAMVAASPEVQASFLLSTIRAQARREALEEVAGYFDERGHAYRAAGLDIKADYADSEACAIRSLISREAPTNRAKALSDIAENDAEQIDIDTAEALARNEGPK